MLYPFFIIYYSFLFSSLIDSKYIIIGLSLVGIEIISLLVNVLLKNFLVIHFFLSSTSLSLIGLIFFSVFWIKSWFPILYISIFWLITNGCFIFWNIWVQKISKLELDEHFFSVLAFNYNIILAFSFLIKYFINFIVNYIKERIGDNSDELQKKKYFYLYNFIILFIQYVIIITLIILGFGYKFNEILIEYDVSLAVKYISFLAFIFILCIVIMRLYENQNNKWLIIFHIFYPPFLIYYSFLFSSFFNSKYIIIGLSLVGIEIFSLLLNIFLKQFETKHFFLFATCLSFIGLVFFSVLWIKSWFPILFVSLFWLLSNGIYISIILAIHKFCESYDYFYSSLIFDYNIILGIILIILKSNLFIFSFCQENNKDDDDDEKGSELKIYGTLLLQYAIITVFVWVGFSFGWNDGLREDFTGAGCLVGISTLVNIIICAYLLNSIQLDNYEGNILEICIIFHVPIMIIYIYGFSRTIENKYILSFVFILFFDFLSIILCISVFSSHSGAIFSSCFYSNILCIILFHFFWLNNVTALIWLIVLSIFSDIYLAIVSFSLRGKTIHTIFSIAIFDYGFFSFILYLLYLFYKCGDSLRKCCCY